MRYSKFLPLVFVLLSSCTLCFAAQENYSRETRMTLMSTPVLESILSLANSKVSIRGQTNTKRNSRISDRDLTRLNQNGVVTNATDATVEYLPMLSGWNNPDDQSDRENSTSEDDIYTIAEEAVTELEEALVTIGDYRSLNLEMQERLERQNAEMEKLRVNNRLQKKIIIGGVTISVVAIGLDIFLICKLCN